MESNYSCRKVVEMIDDKVRELLPPDLTDKTIIAVGLTPHSEEAKKWAGFPVGITLMSLSLAGQKSREMLSTIEAERAMAKMVQADAEYVRTYAQFCGGKIQREYISHESETTTSDCAVVYKIKEHNLDKKCGFGEAPVMDIYVYVKTGDPHESRKAAWSVEPLLINWARESGMWNSSHKTL